MFEKKSTRPAERLVFLSAAVLAVCWLLVLALDAEAYIDPSAGGMLVQLLLAGTAGVAVLGKLFWARIRRFFGAADSATTSDTKLPPDA
jgi:hypothetical protein